MLDVEALVKIQIKLDIQTFSENVFFTTKNKFHTTTFKFSILSSNWTTFLLNQNNFQCFLLKQIALLMSWNCKPFNYLTLKLSHILWICYNHWWSYFNAFCRCHKTFIFKDHEKSWFYISQVFELCRLILHFCCCYCLRNIFLWQFIFSTFLLIWINRQM